VTPGSPRGVSLLDGELQTEHDEANDILVGATEEKAVRTMELYQLNGTIKKESDLPADYLASSTSGVVWGEGSCFFVLSSEKSENTNAQLVAVTFINKLEEDEVTSFISEFLAKNNMETTEIDAVLLGFSGDARTDGYYRTAQSLFQNAQQLYF